MTLPDSSQPDIEDRRIELDAAARRVIDNYMRRGLPFALYLRKYDVTVLHGPEDSGRQLLENSLLAALPDGNVVTIQDRGDLGSVFYSGRDSVTDRRAPALMVSKENWRETVAWLIARAELIVSECLMLTDGVKFELETVLELERWDRTVLLLPPLQGALPVIDSDSTVQSFPRCVWADVLHTEPFLQQHPAADLVERLQTVMHAPEKIRCDLVARGVIDQQYPVSLLPLATGYENDVQYGMAFGDPDDERMRYYDFWKLFRARGIRVLMWHAGDHSIENRMQLGEDYRVMSQALLECRRAGDRIVVLGDLDFAERCARSARELLVDFPGLGRDAEDQWARVCELRKLVKTHPDRFVVQPRYGPFAGP